MRVAIFLLALTILAQCAARPSNPVAISQPGDAALGCAELAKQRASGREAATSLTGADAALVDQNVAAGVGSVLFWPTMFAIDLSNAEQIELRALQDRDATLARLEAARGC